MQVEQVLNDILTGKQISYPDVAELLANVQMSIATTLPVEQIPQRLRWLCQKM